MESCPGPCDGGWRRRHVIEIELARESCYDGSYVSHPCDWENGSVSYFRNRKHSQGVDLGGSIILVSQLWM